MKSVVCYFAFLALASVEAVTRERYARCKLRPNTNAASVPDQKLSGTIWFQEVDGVVTVSGSVRGFTSSGDGFKHGFHIHAGADQTNDCNANGGHFNPMGVNHGEPAAAVRHYGDLGNIVVQSQDAVVSVDNQNTLVTLEGNHSVIGKSIVVHSGEDDMGLVDNDGSRATGNAGSRLACCVIEEYVKQRYTATCDLAVNPGSDQNIDGTITFVQDMTAAEEADRRTRITGMVGGFSTGDGSSEHGFHIHVSPPGADNNCGASEGHYNPEGITHGGPDVFVRHFGDLGNIIENGAGDATVDMSDNMVELFGKYSVIDRAIVVHAGKDDFGLGGDEGSLKTGNAGARLGCCRIVDTTETPAEGASASAANHVVASVGFVLSVAYIISVCIFS